MKRILITGAGGSPAVNFVRSLRDSGEPFHLIGVDSDKFALQRAETDERHLVPPCRDADYIRVLNHFIGCAGAQLLYAQPDVEIAVLSENRDRVACPMFLPSRESIRVCQDKFISYEKWRDAGLPVPQTMMIGTTDDLRECFVRFGPKIWIRETKGAFGKGSLPTSDFDQACAWLDF
jgi:biotin carboxylase